MELKDLIKETGIYLIIRDNHLVEAFNYLGEYHKEDGSQNNYPFIVLGSDDIYNWRDIEDCILENDKVILGQKLLDKINSIEFLSYFLENLKS